MLLSSVVYCTISHINVTVDVSQHSFVCKIGFQARHVHHHIFQFISVRIHMSEELMYKKLILLHIYVVVVAQTGQHHNAQFPVAPSPTFHEHYIN